MLTHFYAADSRKLADKIKKKGGGELKPVTANLVDAIWSQSKPDRPNEPVKVLDTKYSGKKFEEKLQDLRKELEKKKSLGFIVCKYGFDYWWRFSDRVPAMLDEIAWLYNLRGSE